ncbi:DUF2285 domain-containing protein [Sphingobium sp.]|uniref:DUF2285 domain-containing protein n=1 Tax=Sphingobium sp. TaxID=1912891 RepID=UPI000DB1E3BF|nr:DUF2285 domain-containing protein [Sphingobium sp.]PZU68694.1 MAG: hypothetical protein DI540_08060 [Sphingobium sp.]
MSSVITALDWRDSPEGQYAIHPGKDATQTLLLPDTPFDQPLAAVIPLSGDLSTRIAALERLWRAWQNRPIPPDTRLTAQKRRRFGLAIQATDGWTRGASYREIAEVIFGADRVASHPWKTSSLRDTIIGLVEGGRTLIAGGYLRLLRKSRHDSKTSPD